MRVRTDRAVDLVWCPRCGAEAGDPCRDQRFAGEQWVMNRPHRERVAERRAQVLTDVHYYYEVGL